MEELVATYGNHGDERHELLEVTLGVFVDVQTLHQPVEGRLILHVLQVRRRQWMNTNVRCNFEN